MSGTTDATIRTPDHRLRVFISSTLGELSAERRVARAAVESLRLTPVMFEIGARPHAPQALYRSYLAQSDVFVGIYWQRYGWVGPDMDVSGLEDELLLSEGMPRLLYVKRPAPEMGPALKAMLERVEQAGSASYKPFSDAAELQDLIQDDLAILLTERFDGGSSRVEGGSRPRHDLPAQTSTFIGREAELRRLQEMLDDPDVRLITLRGPAGTGKTRLAIRGATDSVERFADGVCFVDLSAERERDGAMAALARAVGASVPTGTRPVDVLGQELADRELLVVLDNFEQVMSAAVDVAELVARCPRITVMVTSREALRVRGEHDLPVPPLGLPDGAAATADSEAVRLFCDRAEAVRAGFELTADNQEAVADICRRLDGLPLAVELASARMQLLDAAELRERLIDRLDVLGGARDLPERQQTLRRAFDWSYDLLDESERQMLRVFAEFAGGRLTDIEATAARMEELTDLDVVEACGSLVAKSLVRRAYGSDGRPRLSMLRTIRAYVQEGAQEFPDFPDFAEAARLAHAQQFTEVASELHRQIPALGRDRVLAALGDDLANVQAAWNQWVARDDVSQLNRLLAPLWGYYDARGDYRSAIRLGNDLLQVLSACADSPERRRDELAIRMSVVRTQLAVHGYTSEAEHLILDALAHADDGDARERFPALRALGYLHQMRSDFEGVGRIAEDLLKVAEADHDPLLLSEARLLSGLSQSWQRGLPAALDDFAQAVEHAEATREGYVDFRVGTHPAVVANVVSALMQWMAGTPDTARATIRHALEVAADLDHPYSTAFAMHHAALLDMWSDDTVGLAARTDALERLADAHDYPVWRALALTLGGLADVRSGRTATGLARSEEGFQLYRGLSAPPVFWPALLMIRAVTLAAAGQLTNALAAIGEADRSLRDGDPMAPDVGLVHAELLLAASPPDPSAAEAKLEHVEAIAATRGCRMARLQALTRLAHLRRGTEREHETIAELDALYDSLAEGFELAQLVAARAVLGERTLCRA